MDNEVFRALLALDSYNRGYHPGIAGLQSAVGAQIGDAEVVRVAGDAADEAIGFYAIAYSWNGETIISYRGTDELGSVWPPTIGNDVVYGWPLGAGEFEVAQGWRAIEFYKAVALQLGSTPQTANISMTGHSLGGGLATLVTAVGRVAIPASENLTITGYAFTPAPFAEQIPLEASVLVLSQRDITRAEIATWHGVSRMPQDRAMLRRTGRHRGGDQTGWLCWQSAMKSSPFSIPCSSRVFSEFRAPAA